MSGKKKRVKKSIIIAVIAAILVFLLIAFLIIQYLSDKKKPEKIDFPTQQTEESTEEETQEESSEEVIPPEETEEEIVYPPPSYDFEVEEITIPIKGIEKAYTLAWVSDLHMLTDRTAADDVQEEFLETIQTRYDFFVTQDGIHSDELWPEVVKFLNTQDLDGIIFGGDMMDYCSRSNMDYFLQEYSNLKPDVPLLYIRADHDYGFWYGGDAFTEPDAHEVHKEIDEDELSDKYMEFDDFIIAGVNASTKDMPSYQYDMLLDLMSRDKPVIVATHVPYASKVDASLEELSMQVRSKVYYWGGGSYIPNNVTTAFMEEIYAENTPVCKVVAGHLHAKWDGNLTQQVSQHIFSPAYEGVIGMIQIVPE